MNLKCQKVLTIVVPSYNTSEFIDKNIPTLLDESILDELEVLIINDGSKDDTSAAARKYEEKYPGTVRVVDKENGGHGSVINKGIGLATGEYFKVVDGDDWVDTEGLCRLIQDLKKQDADLVTNPYDKIDAVSGGASRVVLAKDYGVNLSLESVCAKYRQLELPCITVKTRLLRDTGIRVREHCMYEDSEYDLFPTPYIRTITALDYPVYQYLINQAAQSISAGNAFKNRNMHYAVLLDCIQYYDKWKQNISDNKRVYMFNVIIKLIRSQYNIYLRNGSHPEAYDEFVKFNRDFKRQYPDYFSETGKRCLYIRAIQNNNRTLFRILSVLVQCYEGGK